MALLVLTILCTGVRAQSLDSLKAELRRENPELRALQLDYEAATKIGAQQNQLPDLEIGAGVFVLPIETRTGPQQFRIGATQMLPWPGKLAALAELADARARPVLEQAAAKQLELIYQLETAYYQMAAQSARVAILRESLDLYESLNRLALSRVETGQGSSVDVYRIQLEKSQIWRRLSEFDALIEQDRLRINNLLNRPLDTPVVPVLNLEEAAATALITASLLPEIPDLTGHPQLRIYELQQEINRQSIAANDLDARPDFGVGLDYIATGSRTDMMPPGNGRDVILPRAMVTLPLGKRKYTAKRQEEEIRIRALATRQEGALQQLQTEVAAARVVITDTGKQLGYLAEQQRIIAATLSIANSEYSNGKRPFDELLRLQNQAIELRTVTVLAQAKILNQRAIIDRYLLNQ
ncbi:TolC family protein [Neolewinella antarctica]|uniref:Outer membrane protein TolC n=1 Tax=Neolewinella antarctica TaxID=442734 RepID=A0ABX0X9D9_9BACT|nr:TolC family protein [Neolewinella antarctica]NJC25842.1 outer membrane protein TolC [Neolewinella antarctica]